MNFSHRLYCILYVLGQYELLLQEKVYLVDFNPFGVVTDSLMFDWEELNIDSNIAPDVRYHANIM